MKFTSSQVKGKGRGKLLGYPTINLEIPKDLQMEYGIYAVKVKIGNKDFIGALHFGSIPTFDENDATLEIFLVDTQDSDIPDFKLLEADTIKYIRPILNFSSQEELSEQIKKDVEETKKIILNP